MSTFNIVCPLCPLHCDLVQIRAGRDSAVANNGCGRCTDGIRSLLTGKHASRVGDTLSTFDHAIAAAIARIAGDFRVTVVANTVDLVTARDLLELAEQDRLRLATEATPAESAFTLSFVRDGRIGATFGDVRKHADLVWMIGWPGAIRTTLRDQLTRSTDPPTVIEFDDAISPAEAAAFSAVVHGDVTVAGAVTSRMEDVLGHFSDPDDLPRYVSIVIGPNAIEGLAAEAVAPMLNRAAMKLNESTRSVTVTVDTAATLRSVAAWKTNRSVDTVCSDQTLESFVRIGSAPVGSPSKVAVQIGGVDPGAAGCEVFLATQVPGIHQAGSVIRGDSSVTLPLQGIADAESASTQSLPSAIDVLNRVLDLGRTSDFGDG